MDETQFKALIKPTRGGKSYQCITHENASDLKDKCGCLARVVRKTKKGTTDYLAGGFIKYVDPNLQYLYVNGVVDKTQQYCYQIPTCVFFVLPKTDPEAEIKHWANVAANL